MKQAVSEIDKPTMTVTPDDFAIVTSVFNGEQYLGRYFRTLRDLVDGTAVQVVVVDNGSTDETAALLTGYSEQYGFLKFIKSERSRHAAALNLGVSNAERPIIAIQDVDDISLPGRLNRLAALLEAHPNATLFATKSITVDENRLVDAVEYSIWSEDHEGEPAEIFDASTLFKRLSVVAHSALCFRRCDWERCGGYDETLKSWIDLDFYFRLLKLGYGVVDPAVSSIYSRNPNSTFRKRSNADYRHGLYTVLAKARARNDVRLEDLAIGYLRATKYTLDRYLGRS